MVMFHSILETDSLREDGESVGDCTCKQKEQPNKQKYLNKPQESVAGKAKLVQNLWGDGANLMAEDQQVKGPEAGLCLVRKLMWLKVCEP